MLLVLTSSLLASPMALAWSIVYDLRFEVIGESINFRPYAGGYYIAPRGEESNSGTLILLRTSGNQKQYFQYRNFGEIFYAATNGANQKAVFTATAANDVSTTTFYAIGSAKDRVSFKGTAEEGTFLVARELKGFAVSADSERDLPFAEAQETDPYDIGVAGATVLTCRYNDTYTEYPTKAVLSRDDTVQKIIDILAEAGYVDGNPQGGGGGGGGDDGTAPIDGPSGPGS
jgi:hypothetical protein